MGSIFVILLCVLLLKKAIKSMLSSGLSAFTQSLPSCNITDTKSKEQINRNVPHSQRSQKTKEWTRTYGEHIGGRVMITQVPSEKRIQQDLDVVGAVLFPFKGVSVVCPAWGYWREKASFYSIIPTDWHLDSLHTWMSVCKPFASHSTKHAHKILHTVSL